MLFSKAPACGWLVVGLGNPGQNYARTRHNVGFRAVDALAEKLGVKIDRARFRGLTAQASAGGEKLLLLKPQTFMNVSGLSVMDAARFYKLPPERVLVLFDDISLPVGRSAHPRRRLRRGPQRHQVHHRRAEQPELSRVKIGVGAKPHPDYDLADWVLSNFTGPEDKLITEAAARAADAALEIIARGVPAAANDYNGAGPQ